MMMMRVKHFLCVVSLIVCSQLTQAQQNYEWDWGFSLDGGGMSIDDIAGDETGNTYAVGVVNYYFYAPHDTIVPIRQGIQHSILIKATPKGHYAWARVIEADYPTKIWAVTCSNEYIYCALGSGRGNIYVGEDTLVCDDYFCGYILKYDSSGELAKTLQLNNNTWVLLATMDRDLQGNLIVIGNAYDDIYVNTDTVKLDTIGPFLLKISPDLELIWGTSIHATSTSMTNFHITSDREGNTYASGQRFFDLVFDGDTIRPTLEPSGDAILKFDQNGKFQWAYLLEGTIDPYKYIGGLTTDREGNLYFCGAFEGDLMIGDSLYTALFADIFFISLYPDGSLRWGYTYPYPKQQAALSLRATSNGLYMSGGFPTYLKFGDTLLENDGTHAEVFMAKFDFEGNYQWVYTFNQEHTGSIRDFIQDGNKIRIAGNMANDWRIGDTTLYAPLGNGKTSMYFAQFTDKSVTVTGPPPDPPFVEAIFPNPTDGRLNLNLMLPQAGALRAQVFDPTGRLIQQIHWPYLESGQQKLQTDLQNLSNGLYFLRLKADDLEKTVRILVRH